MGSWLTVAGVKPYDGRYPFDIGDDELTRREWGWVKRMTGFTRLTLNDGFKAVDDELWACFAVIALYRAGRVEAGDAFDVFDRFADVTVVGAAVTIEGDTADAEEGDAGPPAVSSSSRLSTSGDATTTSSETTSADGRNGSGTPGSDISESLLTGSAT